MSETIMKGRDVAAPVKQITFMGQRYAMKFNNRAARIAEDIYADQYGADIGYYAIMAEVAMPKHRALMALIYAGIKAAGADVTWEDFDENFRITDVDGVAQAVRHGVIQSLPDEDPDGNPEEKNAPTPTE
ncbi:MAG: hypothetical protein IKK21_06140 [Clostridia bacterium]|nr:hypothetical protein [Clostridia bacterium]